MRLGVLAVLLLLPLSARAEGVSSGACAPSGGHDFLADLKEDLYRIGAHVLQTVDPVATYPATPAARAIEEARLEKEVAKRLKDSTPADARVVAELRATGASDVDLFHGSHVVVKDGGARYERWQALGARPRTSSHYVGVPYQQYELVTAAGVVLFGKTGDGDTWFQMEAHPDGPDRLNWFLHRVDFVRYHGLGDVDVGPMGLSPFTEKHGNPVVLPDPGL